jgi:GNAT superfamily N-acetyltransferase
MNEVKYILRAGPSFKPIAEALEKLKYPPANPIASIGWTAEYEKQQAGLIVIQSIPLIYPLIVTPEWRNNGVGTELVKRAADYVIHQTKAPRVLAHTNHEGIQDLIRQFGMTPLNEQLFEWLREK